MGKTWRRATNLLALVLAAGTAASVATEMTQEPASEGRLITPAGELILDMNTHQPAVGSLPVALVRSPDTDGPDGRGRYLIAVNSGYGVQFSAATNHAQQSLSVIDVAARPPMVIQTVYFPSPQSANVGLAFGRRNDTDGSWPVYVGGGFGNNVWVFTFRSGERMPLAPPSPGPSTRVEAPEIDLTPMATVPASHAYNDGKAAVYPTGLATAPDGRTLFVANNLGDTLGIVSGLDGELSLRAVPLGLPGARLDLYPYDVVAVPDASGEHTSRVFVSLWGAGAVAVVDVAGVEPIVTHVPVARHPTAMLLNRQATRLYVADSDADAVSVIDTRRNVEIERIDVRLTDVARPGTSPQGLALDRTETRLLVANAHANAVAVVALSSAARGDGDESSSDAQAPRSRLLGLIPTGQYPSALAVVGDIVVVANGKGIGFASSSMSADGSGRAPTAPNYRFPAKPPYLEGQYVVSLVAGTFSAIPLPDEVRLAAYSQQVLHNNGMQGRPDTPLFPGPSPITHVIYVIRENRTYDQVFGDVPTSGDGTPADGDPTLAIFGHGDAARVYGGPGQDVTPNARALALRFGLLDRFFVNAEASPDGHNWCTAAFSTDYVDKAFRWNYSGRGRPYDFEGFNRLPRYEPPEHVPAILPEKAEAADVAAFMRRFVPYLHGGRDVAEPETLYLWDAAGRAGLSYRNYGEFIGTVTAGDVAAMNGRKRKEYPDLSPVLASFATKQALEGSFAPTYPNFDLTIPDAMTVDSYAAVRAEGGGEPLVARSGTGHRFAGTSRMGEWMVEFEGYLRDLQEGRGDTLPALSIVRLPNDHTAGLRPGMPTPQFMVADNDYALGLLVAAVSHSAYWKNTAIFVVEDDAQAGPDHVDGHRSVALVVSAYNRPGVLVHDYHTTVSLIRTIELLLGIQPMNQLDATASPIRVFQERPDLTPYTAILPDVAAHNLLVAQPRDETSARWVERTEAQDLSHADMADPAALNRIIWHSVRGTAAAMPRVARLPVFDVLTAGIAAEAGDADDEVERMEARRRAIVARLACSR